MAQLLGVFPMKMLILATLLAAQLEPNIHMLKHHTSKGDYRVCRLRYEKSLDSNSDGDGWNVDYPRADLNLTRRISELSKIPVSGGGVVRATDKALFDCPILFMSEPGSVTFSDADVKALRTWFDKGGFLWVDDFWGEKAWAWWVMQIGRILPPSDYPTFDIPSDHPLRNSLYKIDVLTQIPNIGLWMDSHITSERGEESAVPHLRGIADLRDSGYKEQGRVIVVMTHNTDLGDAFEEEGSDPSFLLKFSVPGYALGMNILIYALTH